MIENYLTKNTTEVLDFIKQFKDILEKNEK